MPEPGPHSSRVGDPGRVTTEGAARDQRWERKTGQQGPAVQMSQESVQRTAWTAAESGVRTRKLAASLTPPSLIHSLHLAL